LSLFCFSPGHKEIIKEISQYLPWEAKKKACGRIEPSCTSENITPQHRKPLHYNSLYTGEIYYNTT
jgi:hypothetical protein